MNLCFKLVQLKSKATHSLPTRLAREESRSSDTSFSGCWPGSWLEPARVGFRMPPAISDKTDTDIINLFVWYVLLCVHSQILSVNQSKFHFMLLLSSWLWKMTTGNETKVSGCFQTCSALFNIHLLSHKCWCDLCIWVSRWCSEHFRFNWRTRP